MTVDLNHRYYLIDTEHDLSKGHEAFVMPVRRELGSGLIVIDGSVVVLGTGDSPELALHNTGGQT